MTEKVASEKGKYRMNESERLKRKERPMKKY